MDTKKQFINPYTMDLQPFIDQITSLNNKVVKNTNLEIARMNSNFTGKYAEILEREKLPIKGMNTEDVYTDLARYSQGLIRWAHPGALININPPTSIPAAVASSYFSLYNPNGAQDMSCGYLLTTELAVVKMISELAGIDYTKSGGVFTFGGKSTNLHGVKHGLQRISRGYINEGITDKVVVFSSKQGHPCHSEVCGWLGIGEENCIRISTDKMGRIKVDELRKAIESALESRKKVATIILNGGTTIQMTIDPIKEVVEMRDEIVEKYSLDYTPRVHVDSVSGWVWLFFKDYDYKLNPLRIDVSALKKIQDQYNRIKDINRADSFGVDFHKTGFTSYISSLYMTKDANELYHQSGGFNGIPYDELEYGNYSPFQYTLELSRSVGAPLSAYVNLKVFGVEGYQKMIADLMNSAEYFKDKLDETGRFEAINKEDSNGFVTLLVASEAGNKISFFDLGSLDIEKIRKFSEYNYKFLKNRRLMNVGSSLIIHLDIRDCRMG